MPTYRHIFQLLNVFIVAIFLLFSAKISSAEELSDRDTKIQKSLECAAIQAYSNQDVRWADVCYSMDDPTPRGDGREDLIDSELRRAESRAANNTYEPEPMQTSDAVDMSGDDDLSQYNDNEQGPQNFASLGEVDSEQFQRVQFELAPEIYYYRYTEVIGVKFSGMKFGLAGAATLRLSENHAVKSIDDIWKDENKINVLRFEGRYSFGAPDYSSESGTVNSIPDHNLEFRLLAGYEIPATESTRVTPYVGVGYRYIYNQFSEAPPTASILSGYDRESSYYYLPLGVDVETKLDHGWSIGWKGEFDWLVLGKQKSHFEDMRDSSNTSAGYEGLINDQKSGLGARFSFRIKKAGEKMDTYFEPFVRYWHIQNSTINTSCGSGGCLSEYEPDNKTWEIGVNAGAQF